MDSTNSWSETAGNSFRGWRGLGVILSMLIWRIFSESSDSTCSDGAGGRTDRKSTRLNSSHANIYTLSLHDAFRSELVPSIHCPNDQRLNNSVLPDGFD